MKSLLRWLRPKHQRALAFVLLALAVLAYCGHRYLTSEVFQLALRTRLVAYLEKATGGVVHLDGFRFDPLHGRARLSGLTIAGVDAAAEPFLEVDEVVVDFSLRSPFADRQLELRSVRLDKPRLRIHLLADSKNNIPRTGGQGRANLVETVFRASIGHVEIRQGLVILKSANVPLNLTLADLKTNLELDHSPPYYKGHLEFQDSSINVRGFRAQHLALRTDLAFYSQGVELNSGRFAFASTEVLFSGLVANLYSPDLRFEFNANSSAEDLQASLGKDLGIRGPFEAAGLLTLDGGRFRTTGNFSSRLASYHQLQPQNLRGQFDLKSTGIHLHDIAFDLLGGSGRGALSLDWHGGGVSGKGEFQTHELDARQGLKSILNLDLPLATLLEGQVQLGWMPEKESFYATAEALAVRKDSKSGTGSASGNTAALSPAGKIFVRYNRGVFNFNQTALSMGTASLTASGSIALDKTAELDLSYESQDLKEMARQLALIAKGALSDVEPWLESFSSQRVRFEGQFLGMSAVNPLQGRLILSQPKTGAAVWDSLQTRVALGHERVSLEGLELTRGDASLRGQLAITLASRLNGPPAGHIELVVSTHQIPLPLLMQATKASDAAGGLLQGSFTIRGRYPDLEGRGHLELLQADLFGESFDRIQGEVLLAGSRVEIRQLQGQMGVKKVRASGWFDFNGRRYQLAGEGNRWDLAQLVSRLKSAEGIRGELDFKIQGQGNIDNPSFAGTFHAGSPACNKTSLQNLAGDFRYTAHVLEATARAEFLGGTLSLLGRADWQNLEPFLSAEIRAVSVDPFRLQDLPPPQGSHVSSGLSGRASVTGPLSDPRKWKASLSLSEARLKFGELEFRSLQPVEPHYSEGRIHIESVEFAGNKNRFTLSGNIVLNPQLQLDLKLASALDLNLFNAVLRGARLGGLAAVSVNLQGDPANPKILGSCRLQEGSLGLSDFPYSLSGLQGIVYFNENLGRLINIRGSVSTGGTATFNGTINLENMTIKNFVILAELDQVSLRVPQGFRTVSNAELTLRGDLKSQLLLGEIDVEEATYTRSVDLLAQLTTASSAPAVLKSGPSALDTLSLDLAVRFKSGISLSTETVRLTADGRLRLLGPAANPSLLGRIAAETGEITFLGNHYEITKGGVEFVNPLRIEPHFDVAAQTTIKGYKIHLLLRGTPDNIQPDLRSEPPLPVLDLVTLLSAGVTSQELVGTSSKGSSGLGLAASNILAEGLSRQVESRVQRMLGFRQFKIDPFLAGRSNNPTARVTMERRLSSRLSVTYSTDITTSQEQIVLVEYFMTPHYSLVVSRDENGKFGLDLRIQRNF